MRVLVTGKHGQLARSLVERAHGRGIELLTAGRPDADMEVPGSMAAAIRDAAPDMVINAAAYTSVDQAEDEPERAFRINAEAAGEAAEAARAIGAPIVQLSTDYVFDGRGTGPYGPGAPTAPLGIYGRSKLDGEEKVRSANPDHVIVRTAWVFSPFGRNFVKTMMGLAERSDTVRVVGDQRGNPSSALDLAEGLLAMLERWRAGERTGLGSVYHLGGTGEASWAEFAAAIFEECRKLGLPAAEVEPIATADWPTRAVRPANSTLDSSRFSLDFGYEMPEWRLSARDVVRRLAGAARPA
jgi:dTDP-4-dehydrorhamnose reductase